MKKTFLFVLSFVLLFCLSFNVSNANNHQNKSSIQLKIYPNPSSQRITINAKIFGYENDCLISIRFYNINGKFVKEIFTNSGIEKSFTLDDIKSGVYLIAATTYCLDEKKELIRLSDSELIIIEK